MVEGSRFAGRRHAGRELALLLSRYAHRQDVVVLGLPRGGMPVAFEVAQALGAPLDVFLVRKLGVPGHEELAMGAIASGGVTVLNHDVIEAVGISRPEIDGVAARERAELERHELSYREGRPALDVRGRVGILVDDGLATGATMRAAISALRNRAAGSTVVAVPTAPRETCAALQAEADEVICAMTPDPFMAVGLWYRDFSPTADEEVRSLLARANAAAAAGSPDRS
jgi:predicted phosphoribosyltransferase